jgi:transposase
MTQIYCFVDDCLKANPKLAQWRTSPNQQPAFTDAEVITIALMQPCLGVATLKQTYRLIAANYAAAFPRLCSYPQWLARLHRLSHIIGILFEATHWTCTIKLYTVDAKPIAVCKPIRHGRVRLLREDGAYFGKTSAGWFFGFKLHLLRNAAGLIVGAMLTPANWDDRPAALELAQSVDGGIVLGDLGYSGPNLAGLLAEQCELLMITRRDAPAQRKLLSSVRQGIETMLSQLWHNFIDRVFSRSWQGLWNTIKLKLINYNLRQTGILSI